MLRAYLTFGFAILLSLSFSSCRKNALKENPEFEGSWRTTNATLNVDEDGFASYAFAASSGNFSATQEAEGRMKIKDDEFIIKSVIAKRFDIDLYPTPEQAGKDLFNTIMVLDEDTFYKLPIQNIDLDFFCSNGTMDRNETGVDCGGSCEPCESCDDGVMNQSETGVDCGGECNSCPNATCFNEVSMQEGYLMHCPGNNIFSEVFVYETNRQTVDTILDYIEVYLEDNSWSTHIKLTFNGTTLPDGAYPLLSDYDDIEYHDPGLASIQYRAGSGTVTSEDGTLYVSTENGKTILTWCDVECSASFIDCLLATGKVDI